MGSCRFSGGRRVVFMDVDGTLVRSSLERSFFAYIIRSRRFYPKRIAAWCARNLQHRRFRIHSWKMAYVAGTPRSELMEWIEEWWQKWGRARVYRAMADAVRFFTDRAYRVILLSGSVDCLAQPLADDLGIDSILASIPVFSEGICTGRLAEPSPVGQRKVLKAEQIMHTLNLDWSSSWAFGNRYLDRFILQKCRFPVVVDPDTRLFRLARRETWYVIRDPVQPIDWNRVYATLSGGNEPPE